MKRGDVARTAEVLSPERTQHRVEEDRQTRNSSDIHLKCQLTGRTFNTLKLCRVKRVRKTPMR